MWCLSHSTIMKLGVVTLLPFLLLAACNQSQATNDGAGWKLMPERGGYTGSLSYEFSDATRTAFVARCNGTPWFMLLGADYPEGAKQFILVADDGSWTL